MKEGAEPVYSIYRGTDLEGPAYRVVSKCPPTADDFISYAMAQRTFHNKLFFRATGVSVFAKKGEADKLARGGRLGTCVAELDLDDPHIFVMLTNARTGHLDVWAPPRVLLSCVVNCADTAGKDE